MQQYWTGVLLTSLLVVPACMGMWWAPKMKLLKTDSMIHRLQVRRMELKRRGKLDREKRAVNYFFLETKAAPVSALFKDRRSPGHRPSGTPPQS